MRVLLCCFAVTAASFACHASVPSIESVFPASTTTFYMNAYGFDSSPPSQSELDGAGFVWALQCSATASQSIKDDIDDAHANTTAPLGVYTSSWTAGPSAKYPVALTPILFSADKRLLQDDPANQQMSGCTFPDSGDWWVWQTGNPPVYDCDRYWFDHDQFAASVMVTLHAIDTAQDYGGDFISLDNLRGDDQPAGGYPSGSSQGDAWPLERDSLLPYMRDKAHDAGLFVIGNSATVIRDHADIYVGLLDGATWENSFYVSSQSAFELELDSLDEFASDGSDRHVVGLWDTHGRASYIAAAVLLIIEDDDRIYVDGSSSDPWVDWPADLGSPTGAYVDGGAGWLKRIFANGTVKVNTANAQVDNVDSLSDTSSYYIVEISP